MQEVFRSMELYVPKRYKRAGNKRTYIVHALHILREILAHGTPISTEHTYIGMYTDHVYATTHVYNT